MTPIVFDLQIEGLAPGAIQVVRLSGEETLTRPYRFDIDVISSNPNLEIDEFLATSATLRLTRGDDERVIHGVILEASEANEAMGGFFSYRMTLVPRISLLALSRHNRTFATAEPLSVLDVVQKVLSDPLGLGLGPDDMAIRVLNDAVYPERDFWAQYDESDFDFVHRLLEHWGIVYYFEQTDSHERIVFTDATTLAPEQAIDGTLIFSQETRGNTTASGIVRSVLRRLQAVSKTVQLNDYNDQKPQWPLTATSDVPSGLVGAYYEYATHFLDPDEGKLFAQARAEEIGCTRDVFALSSDSPFTTPGVTFAIARHFRPPLNQSYLPTAVRHTGHQYIAGAFWAEAPETPSGYRAEITAIPRAVACRSPRTIPRPVMAGVMPAKVDAPENSTDRAVLDDQGRYKVALDFDTTDNQPYQKSNFLRMAQPYGGTNTGLHFPLLKDTEVIIGWLDGDPDRPMILGAVPNALTKSPVINNNETQNKILTTAGIAVIMNDGPGTPVAAGEPQTPPAQAPTTATGGVYAATVVPAAEGSLPHYERLGVVAADLPYESAIVADPSFQAGNVKNRDSELTNEQYEGIFSYTPNNRTTTTGKNETTVVNGSQNIKVVGTSKTVIGSDPGLLGLFFDTATYESPYVSASVYKVPKIAYYDTQYMRVNFGLYTTFILGGDFRVSANLVGTYEHRVGAKLSLSGHPTTFVADKDNSPASWTYGKKPWGSSYVLSTSGYTYKQIAGIDKKHEIFGVEKIVLGFRGNANTGKKTMDELINIANAAASLNMKALAAAQTSQLLPWVTSLVPIDDTVLTTSLLSAAMLALDAGAVSPTIYTYLKSIRAVIAYFNGDVVPNPPTPFPTQKFLSQNDLKEATVTIDKAGVTSVADTAKIVVAHAVAGGAPAQITLSVGPNSSITIKSDEIIMTSPKVTITGTDKVIVKANDATTAVVASAGNKVTLGGDKISLAAPTTVADKLTVQTGGCAITGQLKATTAQIG